MRRNLPGPVSAANPLAMGSAIIVAAANKQDLAAAGLTKKGDSEDIRSRGGPDSRILTVKLMHAERRMLLVVIQQAEGFHELTTFLGGEIARCKAR